jgi:acyl dehydratase
MRAFDSVGAMRAAVGERLGESEWLEINQNRIDTFAEATGDHQWIHVDPERAAAGPFGSTIAHGYLTLSLLPFLGRDIWSIGNVKMGINYGLNKVRFPNPVKVGSRLRCVTTLLSVEDVAQGVQVTYRHTLEIEGQERPAIVAETVSLVVPA